MDEEQKALWRQANHLFGKFVSKDAEEAQKWLRSLDVDEEVRSRLDQLIDANNQTVSPLDASLSAWVPATSVSGLQDDLSGRLVGGWVLEELIGQGGMSTVYKARRNTTRYEQYAAIKLLSIALIGTQLRNHFDQEQQILAGLHHPNIAGLLDAGVASDGTPYIAMEFIQGARIDEYVRREKLSAHSIAMLYVQVCDAVAFAQQNLIVHRDIKPSNILIDAHGQAKLLDFGIARLLEKHDVDTTSTRAFTPGYAAPEQHAGKAITTATDVFGLGVVLYGLLTGQRAFGTLSGEELKSPTPACRLNASVDADLSNIAQMAMRIEADRRYPNAAALADDLRAWLNNRPVVATPDSRFYRVTKYLRRNRVGVAAAFIIVFVGLAGIIGTLWQVQRAKAAAAEATATAHRAQAVQEFLLEMFNGADPWTNQNQPLTADELLDSAIKKLPERLEAFPEQKASVLLAISNILRNLGRFDEAAAQAEVAIDLLQRSAAGTEIARGQILLASILIDAVRYDEAQPLLQTAIEGTESDTLTAENVEARTTLARLYTHAGKLEPQTVLIDQLLAEEVEIKLIPGHEQWLGFVYATAAENRENLGRYDEAYAAAVQAETYFKSAHGATHPKVADALGYQSTASFSLGHWDNAEKALNEAIVILGTNYPSAHPALLWAKYQLGRTLLEGGRFDRALAHYEVFHPECVELFSARDPRTIMALTNLGLSYQGVGRLQDARAALEEALPAMRSQSGDNAKVGVAQTRYGAVLSQLGDVAGAEREFEAGIEFLQRNVGSDHPLHARALSLFSEHLLRHNKPQEASKTLTAALPVLEKAYGLQNEFVFVASLRMGLANASLGNAQAAKGQIRSGLQSLQSKRYQAKYGGIIRQAEAALATL